MSKKRIDNLRQQIKKENLHGVVITHLNHVRYLSGFTGSSGLLLITPSTADFFTDFRYKDQAAKQVSGAKVHIVSGEPVGALKNFGQFNVKNRIYGYNGEYLTVAGTRRLQEALPQVMLAPADSVFKELGWVKDSGEIASIEKAAAIADTAFERILNIVRPGIREREISAELEYQMSMLGSEKPAFETIIASGRRSALPHGVASDKKVKEGDFVTFDFGATCDGYVSDMTRTVVVGKASDRQKKVYNIVLKAQLAGLRKVRAGISGKAVDDACRKIIKGAGFGKNFGHGTGHGIGFYIHVGPRLSPLSDDKLLPNNVVTVEPGIYISGWGGVRIEDDVVVTKNGGRVINRSPKNLLEL